MGLMNFEKGETDSRALAFPSVPTRGRGLPLGARSSALREVRKQLEAAEERNTLLVKEKAEARTRAEKRPNQAREPHFVNA